MDILLAATYKTGSPATGVTGLTTTCTVYRVKISDDSVTSTTPTPFEVGGGVYAAKVTSADLATYYYYAVFNTADVSVLEQDVMSVQWGVGAGADLIAAIPTATENADALLKRDWTSVTGEAARSLLNAARFLRNRFGVSGATLTVYKEDDTTSAWTGVVSSDPSAQPIVGNDPT